MSVVSVVWCQVGLTTRPEDSYRMWCVWVWSWILDNEEALAHWGLLRHGKKKSSDSQSISTNTKLQGRSAHCSSHLLLQSAVENNITIFRLPSHQTHTLLHSDKCFYGPLKAHFKNEAAACKITRHHKAQITGFACSTATSVNVNVKCLYVNRNRMPECFFPSVSDSSETTTPMETEPWNMAPICVPSLPPPPPREYSWYSFLLEAESTPGPQCGRKDYVNAKFQ